MASKKIYSKTFRQGQRVVVAEDHENSGMQYDTGTVTRVDRLQWQPDPWGVEVKLDHQEVHEDGYWFHETELQVVSLATT